MLAAMSIAIISTTSQRAMDVQGPSMTRGIVRKATADPERTGRRRVGPFRASIAGAQ
jgi:hypothetical protein